MPIATCHGMRAQDILRESPDRPAPLLAWLGQAGVLVRYRTGLLAIDPYLSDSLAVKYRGTLFPHIRMMPPPLVPGEVTGLNRWNVISCEPVTDETGGEGCIITLAGAEKENDQLEVSITYLLYPELPLIRKKMAFRNTGVRDFRIEALDVEHLKLSWSDTHCWTVMDYGRYKQLGPYVGDWNDVDPDACNGRSP